MTTTAVRKRHEASGTPCVEVHVATPVEVGSERDVKVLHAGQAAGRLTGVTGSGLSLPPAGPQVPSVSRGLGASVRPVCGRRLPARYGSGQTTPGPSYPCSAAACRVQWGS